MHFSQGLQDDFDVLSTEIKGYRQKVWLRWHGDLRGFSAFWTMVDELHHIDRSARFGKHALFDKAFELFRGEVRIREDPASMLDQVSVIGQEVAVEFAEALCRPVMQWHEIVEQGHNGRS